MTRQAYCLLLWHFFALSILSYGSEEETGFCYSKNAQNRCNRLHFYRRVTRERCCLEGKYFVPIPSTLATSAYLHAHRCAPACENLGRCYQERNPLGECRKTISSKLMTRTACCEKKMFFEPAEGISNFQSIEALFGTTTCEPACQSNDGQTMGTCERVKCPALSSCSLKQPWGPVCRCDLACLPSLWNENSGASQMPICTQDYKFRSSCQMYTAACLLSLPLERVVICPNSCYNVECPNVDDRCYLDHLGQPICVSGKGAEAGVGGTADQCATQPQQILCATNNITYENECQMKKHSVVLGYSLSVAYLGYCSALTTCSNVVCPQSDMVCAEHMVTGQPVCVDCTTPLCNASDWTLPRVCGNDYRSYANACRLREEICHIRVYQDLISQSPCNVDLMLTEEFQELMNYTNSRTSTLLPTTFTRV